MLVIAHTYAYSDSKSFHREQALFFALIHFHLQLVFLETKAWKWFKEISSDKNTQSFRMRDLASHLNYAS